MAVAVAVVVLLAVAVVVLLALAVLACFLASLARRLNSASLLPLSTRPGFLAGESRRSHGQGSESVRELALRELS